LHCFDTGTLGDPVAFEGRLHSDALADAVGQAEGYNSKARAVISKAENGLAELHGHMFPKDLTPPTLERLAEVFQAEPSPLVEYSHAQTFVGSQVTLALTAVHGVSEADLERVTSSFPTKADGTEVDLGPFYKSTKPMAKRLVKMLDTRAATKAAALAEKVAARAKKSMNPSTTVE
jgi:hypothetical protein